MHNQTVDLNSFESVLGTPTAQKLIKILVSWSTLSVQDLINKSHVSKSQVHSTLKNLTTHNIVYSPSRGIYTLQDNPFAKLLKEAYHVKFLEVINSEIYNIKILLKDNRLDEATSDFTELVELYQPILQESFPSLLSSLSFRFIEVMKEI